MTVFRLTRDFWTIARAVTRKLLKRPSSMNNLNELSLAELTFQREGGVYVASEGNLGKTWLLPRGEFLVAFSAFTHYNALAECVLTLNERTFFLESTAMSLPWSFFREGKRHTTKVEPLLVECLVHYI